MINFFSYKLEQKDQSQLGVSQVLATIQQGTLEWPRDRLRVCRLLKELLYHLLNIINYKDFNPILYIIVHRNFQN